MKKNFKKTMSVIMAVLMLVSAMSVTVFAATKTVTFEQGSADNVTPIDPNVTTLKITTDPTTGDITLPEAMFKRPGFTQIGWTPAKNGGGKCYKCGELYTPGRTKLYPYWVNELMNITFTAGEFGVGPDVVEKVPKGEALASAPGAIFTRDGYKMIGWSKTDGGKVEVDLNSTTPIINEHVTYYPVWLKTILDLDIDIKNENLGFECKGYAEPTNCVVTIVNNGNIDVTYNITSSSPDFDVTFIGDTTIKAATQKVADPNKPQEGTLVVKIAPKGGLDLGNYSSKVDFVCDNPSKSFSLDIKVGVVEHSFDKYVSNNDATYAADGTKTAVCSNGCKHGTDTIPDVGSKLIYTADNNTVNGLSKEYIHHKTVKFTAFGSGYDNTAMDVTAKKTLEDGTVVDVIRRFVPTEWYVNDEFNGKFTDGNFVVKYVHRDFGKFVLKVTYVEQEYVTTTDAEGNTANEWVATGVEDVKTFNYSIGPSEEDNQEVVVPNMIVTIVFGLLGRLLDLIRTTIGI